MNQMQKLKKYWNRRDDAKEYIKWIWIYTKPYFPKLFIILAFDLFATVLSVGMAIIGKKLIDIATTGDLASLGHIIIIYVFVIIVGASLSLISGLFSSIVYEKFGFGIRKKVYKRILDKGNIDNINQMNQNIIQGIL